MSRDESDHNPQGKKDGQEIAIGRRNVSGRIFHRLLGESWTPNLTVGVALVLMSPLIGFFLNSLYGAILGFVAGLLVLVLAFVNAAKREMDGASQEREKSAQLETEREARVLLFRERFTDAVRAYRLHGKTEESQILRLAFHEAYSLAPVEDGGELEEAFRGVSPTLNIDFEGAHFQGLLNIYHTAQLHGLDLSKHSGNG